MAHGAYGCRKNAFMRAFTGAFAWNRVSSRGGSARRKLIKSNHESRYRSSIGAMRDGNASAGLPILRLEQPLRQQQPLGWEPEGKPPKGPPARGKVWRIRRRGPAHRRSIRAADHSGVHRRARPLRACPRSCGRSPQRGFLSGKGIAPAPVPGTLTRSPATAVPSNLRARRRPPTHARYPPRLQGRGGVSAAQVGDGPRAAKLPACRWQGRVGTADSGPPVKNQPSAAGCALSDRRTGHVRRNRSLLLAAH